MFRAVRFLLASPALAGRRSRAAAVSALSVGVIGAVLLFLPVSLTTRAEGMVWVADQAQVYAGADGFVTDLLVAPGTRVEPGTPVLKMHAPSLQARIAVLEAQRRELEIRGAAERLEHRVRSDITEQERLALEAELELLQAQASSLLVRSGAAGTFAVPEERQLRGRYLRQGQLIGYVISPERLIVRAVVPQSEIGLIRRQVVGVEVRLAERLGETVKARVLRETPAGSTTLPSRALGAAGGGDIAVSMTDQRGLTAAEEVFQVDLGLPEDLEVAGVGERAYVRFDHGAEPLARQWLRSGRQLVLSRLFF